MSQQSQHMRRPELWAAIAAASGSDPASRRVYFVAGRADEGPVDLVDPCLAGRPVELVVRLTGTPARANPQFAPVTSTNTITQLGEVDASADRFLVFVGLATSGGNPGPPPEM